MTPQDHMALLVAFYYCGLLVFSLMGLVWLGNRQAARRQELAAARIARLLIHSVKRRGRIR